MIAVIFEVFPYENERQAYFDIATDLKPLLRKIDGFLSIERFESITTPGKILSLSFWRNEEAITAWRNLEAHRAAQTKGRAKIFADYHIRIATVIRDYTLENSDQRPMDSCCLD